MNKINDIKNLDALVRGELPECNIKTNVLEDSEKLEATLDEYHRNDYTEEYFYDGFYLMLMVDEQYKDSPQKFYWKIIAPNGKEFDLPQVTFKQRSFSYRKVPFSLFQSMTKIIRVGARL